MVLAAFLIFLFLSVANVFTRFDIFKLLLQSHRLLVRVWQSLDQRVLETVDRRNRLGVDELTLVEIYRAKTSILLRRNLIERLQV